MTEAACARHPDVLALGACSRCGSFSCADCAPERDPLLCSTCAPVVTDPLGIRSRSFDVLSPIGAGLKLAAQEVPLILLISFAFAIPGGALQLLVRGEDLRSFAQATRLSAFYDAFFGIVGYQALLARFIARAEGRELSVGAAFSESLGIWGRVFGARFRAGLWILLLTVLLIVPGIWKAVMLTFVPIAAMRARGDPLEVSEALVRGRWWPVLGFIIVSGLVLYVPAGVVAGISTGIYEYFEVPRLVNEVFDDWVSRLAEAVSFAMNLAAFYALHRTAGVELEPMRWRTDPPVRR